MLQCCYCKMTQNIVFLRLQNPEIDLNFGELAIMNRRALYLQIHKNTA